MYVWRMAYKFENRKYAVHIQGSLLLKVAYQQRGQQLPLAVAKANSTVDYTVHDAVFAAMKCCTEEAVMSTKRKWSVNCGFIQLIHTTGN